MLIDVGGHRLHLETFGQGAPTVVFDAGLSEPGPLPRTSGRIVEELRRAPAGAGVAPPYVLVGHSFGGQNMRLCASRHPADVAGLVLVDAQHPDLARRFAAILTPGEWARFLAGYIANREGADLLASDAELAVAAPLPPVVLARGIAPPAEHFQPAWPIAALEVVR